jgi:CTP:molybdopterin cytidylyltransferase MocA
MNPFEPISCIILSAGSSERMGMHKALLKFDEDTTFIEKITNEYLKAGIDKVIVVVSNELYINLNEIGIVFPDEVQLVINKKPELGRLYSLQTSVQHLDEGNYCFFQNIDNPFTSATLLQQLIINKERAKVIIPIFRNKTGHPVLLSPEVISKFTKQKDTELRIDQFLKTFEIKQVETSDEKILANINSLEEYREAGFEK